MVSVKRTGRQVKRLKEIKALILEHYRKKIEKIVNTLFDIRKIKEKIKTMFKIAIDIFKQPFFAH